MTSSYLMPVAYFALALEVVAIMLLILPLVSPAHWSRLFQTGLQVQYAQSGPLKIVRKVGRVPFFAALFFMGIIFYDASRVESESRAVLDRFGPETARENIDYYRADMFQAQRDLYVSGFGLFFVFVIYRLAVILTETARLEASGTAALRQAEAARRTAQSLLSEGGFNAELEIKEKEILHLRKEIECMKSQAAALAADYDRLADERMKSGNHSGNKKAD